MPRNPRPSQKLVAQMAGTSQATVSMVVSGQADAYRIPQVTQDRIRDVMRRVGYVPNVAARSLRAARNGLIGVHTYEQVFPIREDDYYHEFLVGIEEAAVERGVDLVLLTSTLREDGNRTVFNEGMNRLLLADGAIFFGLAKDHSEIARLAADGYPFVFIGKLAIPGADVPYVTADYSGGTSAALDVLLDYGHTRVRYLASVKRDLPQHERLAAYRDECARRGIVEDVLMKPGVSG